MLHHRVFRIRVNGHTPLTKPYISVIHTRSGAGIWPQFTLLEAHNGGHSANPGARSLNDPSTSPL